MSARAFHSAEARARVTAQVKAIEARSAAEVVVVVRGHSDTHRGAALGGGALLAVATLAALILLPQPFADWAFLSDVAVAFVVGTFVTGRSPLLVRSLSRSAQLRLGVRRAAALCFLDHGIHATKRRRGILIYAALFEGEVAVLADSGLVSADLGAGWPVAVSALEGSLRRGLHLDRFLAALAGLGPVLAAACPAEVGQVNELPDAPEDDGARAN